MSGRKNVILPYHLVNDGDMSADILSEPINVQYTDNAGIEVSWTGAPVGNIEVHASVSGNVYYPLSFSPLLTPTGGVDGGYLINLNQLPFKFFKLKYVFTSGTGVMNAYITVKEV